MGGFIGSLTGSNQAKAAQQAAEMLARASQQAGNLRSQGYLDQSQAIQDAGMQGIGTLNSGLTQSLGYQQPYAALGTDALGLLGAGLADGSLTRSFGMSDFQADPSYAFRKQQGMDGIESSAAARGGLLSGAALKSLNDFNSNLASQEYGNAANRFSTDQANRYARLFGLAGMGQNAANNMTNLTTQNATNVGNMQMGIGQARGAGLFGSADARAAGIESAANARGAGLIGAANARATGAGNLFNTGLQLGSAAMTSGMSTMGGGMGGVQNGGVAQGSLNMPWMSGNFLGAV